jgi:hypothetical protein
VVSEYIFIRLLVFDFKKTPSPSFSVTNNSPSHHQHKHSPPVYTVCIGHAESMAAVLLSAGAPGFRYVLPNARVMIHQPHHVISGQVRMAGLSQIRGHRPFYL